MGVVNRKIGAAVKFHDCLHGFRARRGTGTATLEANTLQHLTETREAFIYEIFLDLSKAYDALDRERCLVILARYGIGPRINRVLRIYWEHLLVLAREGKYCGALLKGY